MPSITHSIVIMRLLSRLTSPKPLTTGLVGKRRAIPQRTANTEPVYGSICSVTVALYLIGLPFGTLHVLSLLQD